MQSFSRAWRRALVEFRAEPCADMQGLVQTCRRSYRRPIAETFIETIVWAIVWMFN